MRGRATGNAYSAIDINDAVAFLSGEEVPTFTLHSCEVCGHLVCVCLILNTHPDITCKFRLVATCGVGIECDHGFYVCQTCDPCTCDRKEAV